ncbi:Ger(x)C family spore germination protein [Bacillus suaedae]|uniref:Ger(X)C family spore germination protein n=1 Tax=Halalkalibacter suaedae TaxID=2822140 RepID=A0A940WQW8_9BACI|nr:Ger(x)C family spore germination protein [Bacillus suaedae]MBP3950686.1 Ger(x)C family spore germination protein [Bacillus suaedae]
MRLYHILLLACSCLILASCFDKAELEQQAYVIAVGIDQAEEKGKFNITFQISNPEVGTNIPGGGSSTEEPQESVTLLADDLLSAKNTANSIISREVLLDHTSVVIVSEELARSGQFINIIQSANRTKELRRGVQIIVSKEDAKDFLKNNNPKMETRPHKYYQFMLKRAKETGFIPEADLHRFFQITEGDADLFLAIYASAEKGEVLKNQNEDEFMAGQVPQIGEQKTQFMGSAVFKEGTMIDTLTGEETRFSVILDNTIQVQDVLATYRDPKSDQYRIATRFIKKEKTKVDLHLDEKGQAHINVIVPFNLEILAVPSLVNYSNNEENIELLKKSIEEGLNKKVNEFVAKTQEIYKSEPFYWSLYVRSHFNTITEYETADWHKKIYPNAEITVDCQVKSIMFGKLIKNTDLGEVRD